jgi:hypothetical protein
MEVRRIFVGHQVLQQLPRRDEFSGSGYRDRADYLVRGHPSVDKTASPGSEGIPGDSHVQAQAQHHDRRVRARVSDLLHSLVETFSAVDAEYDEGRYPFGGLLPNVYPRVLFEHPVKAGAYQRRRTVHPY